MVRTQIKLTEKHAEEVKRIARARRVSTAEIIRSRKHDKYLAEAFRL